jgi:hypothetical protein
MTPLRWDGHRRQVRPRVKVAALKDPLSMAAQFTQKLEPLFAVKAAQVRLGSQQSVVDRLIGRATIPIWSYFIRRVAPLLSVETGSGTGIASAFTGWPVLGMMRTDRIRDASIVVAGFPGATLCR